ncbi:hypothetical protein RND81_07G172100 [Saponaria officinalis]|uniref:DNA 3'-5' helicase n=1 Tax=Saponaria officinalis TaxID=3572 RepID=A0AAW1JRX6_SAPOF
MFTQFNSVHLDSIRFNSIMDSDSDSDGSHISATPPRNLSPSPQKIPPKFTTNQTFKPLISLQQKKPYEKPSKILPKINEKPNSKPYKSPKNDSQNNPNFVSFNSSFSLPIKRPNCWNPEISTINSIRAGSCSFSNSSSFSKFNRNELNFDCSEKDPILQCGSGSKPEKEVKKPSNLIASGLGNGLVTSLLPTKRVKCGNEGNFVKLNINGHGRRFTFKNRNSNYSSSSKRNSYRRSKNRWKGKNGEKSNDVGDEEGLNFVNNGEKMSKNDAELVKNTVLDVRNEASEANLVKLLKLTHRYDSFREGQLEAIKMVLARKSTMLVLPTGAGKSLCYHLPAIVFPGITLVVSPLMALMIDQLKHLPSVVNGALLNSSQSFDEMSETLSLLKEGSIKVLFVSPERFLNEEFMSIITSCSLISLVVVDEAHCVSEWSHNFRPSYMRLRASVLRDKLNAQCVLAMTATATRKTLDAVMHALDIPSTNLVRTAQLRDNLQLSVSLSENNNKMKDLTALIKSSSYSELQSIIIYCKFQYETEKIGKWLCDNNVSAMSYHSGMLAKDRSRVQALFCSNKIRVVVATVAFGMGLDKSDVGAVIHFSLPESLEEYVQEIGRAGRDGRSSYCHLFFDDLVYFKLRSLMYSDGVDEYMVNKLLCQIFSSETGLKDETHSLIIESVSRRFDMKEEVILTILTQLELGEVQYLHLPQLKVTCSLNFHKTPSMELAAKDVVVAEILNKSDNKHGMHVFDIPSVANAIGLTTTELVNHLHNLKCSEEIRFEQKDPAYCYIIVNPPSDLCSLSTHITRWLSEIECCKVQKLDVMFNAAAFATKQCKRTDGCDGAQHTPCLQRKIQDYFNEDHRSDFPTT